MVNKKSKLKCPFCNGVINERVYGTIKLKICRECKIAQTDPKPIDIDYAKMDFHNQFLASTIDDLDPIWKKSIYKQIQLIKKYLERGSKILEIGCGQGLILNELNRHGYITSGIEPSRLASKVAIIKGLSVINDVYPCNKISKKKFDCIIITQVLEHIKNPDAFVINVKKNLRKNGILMVTQTNYLGLLPRLMKDGWYAWVPSQHYWHFTPSGLNRYLKKYGFSKKKLVFTSLVHNRDFYYQISRIIPSMGDQFHLVLSNDFDK